MSPSLNRKSASVVVVGSTNTDLVVSVPALPGPGETVLGGDLQQIAGGKGANQAVAAARLGGEVTFIARVGADDYGQQTLRQLQVEGIDTQFVRVTPDVASGIALIAVNSQTGENSIVVAPGANSRLTPDDLKASESAFASSQVLVVSLEIPLETVEAAVELGRQYGLTIVLNPAPARSLPRSLLAHVDVITPNETECEMLGGAHSLLAAGVQAVVTTQGARGARLQTTEQTADFAAPRVTAIDTVAAGDCFTGALAVELASGRSLEDAISFAIRAASLKVTRRGAQPGIPRRAEVLAAAEQQS